MDHVFPSKKDKNLDYTKFSMLTKLLLTKYQLPLDDNSRRVDFGANLKIPDLAKQIKKGWKRNLYIKLDSSIV